MTFGVKEIGMNYDRSLFGMKMSDVACGARRRDAHHPVAAVQLAGRQHDARARNRLAGNSTITA